MPLVTSVSSQLNRLKNESFLQHSNLPMSKLTIVKHAIQKPTKRIHKNSLEELKSAFFAVYYQLETYRHIQLEETKCSRIMLQNPINHLSILNRSSGPIFRTFFAFHHHLDDSYPRNHVLPIFPKTYFRQKHHLRVSNPTEMN